MTTKNLLVELFVEELPPKALKKLGDAFAHQLFDQLKAQGLAGANSVVTAFASPRRLAAHVTHVALKAEDKAVQQKLMPVSVGLTADGQAALLRITNGAMWQLRCAGASMRIEESLWVDGDGRPTPTYQLELTGTTPAGGASVGWLLRCIG